MRIDVSGMDEYAAYASRMLREGQGGVMRRIRGGVASAGRRAKSAVRREALASLPSGYRQTFVSSLSVTTAMRVTGTRATAVIVGRAKAKRQGRDLRKLNAGVLEHPLFGNRRRWYKTRFRPGFWDRAMADADRAATTELRRVQADIVRDLSRG